MTVDNMVCILVDGYTLSELEERFDTTSQDLKHGFEAYVEVNEEKIERLLIEDLYG